MSIQFPPDSTKIALEEVVWQKDEGEEKGKGKGKGRGGGKGVEISQPHGNESGCEIFALMEFQWLLPTSMLAESGHESHILMA